MSGYRCDETFGCFSTILNAATLLNLDFLKDEPLAVEGQISSGGESEEPMLSDPQSGEESHPDSTTRDFEIGGRGSLADNEYMKRTTTETEPEDNQFDETVGYTTVPESQEIKIESNVVPAQMGITRPTAPASDQTNDSNRNSFEEGIEPSVGHSSVRADVNSELDDLDDTVVPREDPIPFTSQGANTPGMEDDDEEGTVREIHDEGESGTSAQKSSPTLSFTHGQTATSPVMFATEEGARIGEEELSEFSDLSDPVIRDRTMPNEAINEFQHREERRSEDVMNTAAKLSQPIQTTQVSLQQEAEPQLQNTTTEQEVRAPAERSGLAPSPAVQTQQASSSEPRSSGPSLPTLPRRTKGLGTGGLPPRGGGSGSSQQGSTQERSSGLPAGIGGSSALPPRHRPTQTPPQPPRAAASTGASGGLPPPNRAHNSRPEMPAGQGSGVANGNGNGGGGGAQPEPPEVVEARQKLRDIRLTMYRVVNRLGLGPTDFSLSEFMAKVDRTEQLRFRGPGMIRPQLDSLVDEAATRDEQQGLDSDLDMTVTVLVLGISSAGKTSVIRNFLHPGSSLCTDASPEPTTKITVHTGKVCGITFNMIDTPGLAVAACALKKNMGILKSVRKVVAKYKPDTVIYVDRLDLFRREFSDAPLLRLVNDMLPELLYNCVALLTRAGGTPLNTQHQELSYSQYYKFRLDVFRQVITYAISDMRWAGRPMGFENFPGCKQSPEGVPILPNGLPFKKQV